MKMKLKQSGFTLVELLVAMAIMGMLIAGVLAAASVAQRSARDTIKKSDLQAVQLALYDYSGSTGKYPVPTAMSGDQVIKKGSDNHSIVINSNSIKLESGGDIRTFSQKNNVSISDPDDMLSICEDVFGTDLGTVATNDRDQYDIGYATFNNQRSFVIATILENGNCYAIVSDR